MTEQTQAALPETINISDLDQFVSVLTAWHTQQIDTLKHLQDIPAGTEVQMDGVDPFTLEGDVLKGFQLGIDTCLGYLGALPFNVDYDDPTEH